MVFVYIGIAVVVLFLFLVLLYNRKNIKEKLKKKSKPQEKTYEDPDTRVDEKKLEYNEFSDPVVKEYSDMEEVFNPNQNTQESFEDLTNEQDFLTKLDLDDFFETEQENVDESAGFDSALNQQISIGSHSLTSQKPSMYDQDDYDEIVDDFYMSGQNESIAKKFADLPDDMKALIVADILNRKY